MNVKQRFACSVVAATGFLLVGLALLWNGDAAAASPRITTAAKSARSAASPRTDAEIDALNQRVDDLKTELQVVFGFVVLLVGGGIVGAIASMRGERRAEQRAITMTDLAVRGESASQRRAEESYEAFRDSSQRTVSLVNDTLNLAREATERAASTLRQRAEGDLAELNSAANDILDPVLLGNDFKKVVEDPSIRGPLVELESEVISLEGYIRSQELELTASCCFVKGMGRYLAQQSTAAIKFLRAASLAADDPRQTDLRIFSQYWRGYELNNVGRSQEAAQVFRRAISDVQGHSERTLELTRIAVESEFFHHSAISDDRDSTMAAVDGFDDELLRLQESARDVPAEAAAIANTRANFWMWGAYVAEKRSDQGAKQSFLERALSLYAEAQSLSPSLWSRFGELEADRRLTQNIDSGGYAMVEEEALQRLTNRREPRSMALVSETRLMAMRWRPGVTREELSWALGDARDRLRDVDDGLTLYSQVRKRNIKWPEFETELSELFAAALASP